MRYRISRVANADLDAIWHHIATGSIDAAERVDDELHKAMLVLARMPGMGHTKAGVKDPRVRFWRVYSYLIAYRIERSTLIVMRVVHAARDLRKLFPKP